MSTIVWVLLMTTNLNGSYGLPIKAEITFLTEAECETALSTLTVKGDKVIPVNGFNVPSETASRAPTHTTASCEPRKAPKKNR
jgi:hypothetical protein